MTKDEKQTIKSVKSYNNAHSSLQVKFIIGYDYLNLTKEYGAVQSSIGMDLNLHPSDFIGKGQFENVYHGITCLVGQAIFELSKQWFAHG